MNLPGGGAGFRIQLPRIKLLPVRELLHRHLIHLCIRRGFPGRDVFLPRQTGFLVYQEAVIGLSPVSLFQGLCVDLRRMSGAAAFPADFPAQNNSRRGQGDFSYQHPVHRTQAKPGLFPGSSRFQRRSAVLAEFLPLPVLFPAICAKHLFIPLRQPQLRAF